MAAISKAGVDTIFFRLKTKRTRFLSDPGNQGIPRYIQGCRKSTFVWVMLSQFKAIHGIMHELSQAEKMGTDRTDLPHSDLSFFTVIFVDQNKILFLHAL